MAQYAVANPKTTVVRPPEVSAVEAACLPVAALTALQALTSGGMNFDGSYSGNVLVTGASGGVGTYAVQVRNTSSKNSCQSAIACGNSAIDYS